MKYYIAKPRLPMEYQEVEYIQSGGTQYINSGVKPNINTKVEIVIKLINNVSDKSLYGCWQLDTDSRFNAWFHQQNKNGFGFGSNNGATNLNEILLNTKTKIVNYVHNGIAYNIANGVSNNYSLGNFVNPNLDMYIFARNNSDKFIVGIISCILFSFKIYNNNSLERDYIPCFRKSDGVIGLYDLCGSICSLTGTPFYINSGTGAFTKGANKTELVKCDIARKVGEFSQLVSVGNYGGNNITGITQLGGNGGAKGNANASTPNFYKGIGFANLTANHKFLITGNVTASVSCQSRMALYPNNIASITGNWFSLQPNKKTNIYALGTNNQQGVASSYVYAFFINASSAVVQAEDFNAFDLTVIFGSGNEPTTYADARKRILQKYHIDITNYVPYGTQMVIERCNIWHDLPRAYQRVEYIESHGTEWIDTGVNPSSNNIRIKANATFTGIPSAAGSHFLFGCAFTNRPYMWLAFFLSRTSPNPLTAQYSKSDNALALYFNSSLDANIDLSVNNGQLSCTCNGVTLSDTCDSYTNQTNNIYIFTRNDNGTASPSLFAKAKLKAFSIISNNVLVRNFIPCYRKSDNVIGLYDTIEDKFYTNQGTGTFGKGADVN